MKTLIRYIKEKLVINKNYDSPKTKVTSRSELQFIISKKCQECVENDSNYLDLTDIDISQIKEFTDLAGFSVFNQAKSIHAIKTIDVTGWETSQIKDLGFLFEGLSNLENIIGLDEWNVKNVKSVHNMFKDCSLLVHNGKLPSWYYEIKAKNK